MRRRLVLALLGVIGAAYPAGAMDLAPGMKAPAFVLVGTDGKEHRLSDFAGQRGLVLAWFPKAFTSG